VLIESVPSLSFLGGFAKFLQESINFVMSICPSAWDNSFDTERIFVKTDIRVIVVNVSRRQKAY